MGGQALHSALGGTGSGQRRQSREARSPSACCLLLGSRGTTRRLRYLTATGLNVIRGGGGVGHPVDLIETLSPGKARAYGGGGDGVGGRVQPDEAQDEADAGGGGRALGPTHPLNPDLSPGGIYPPLWGA